MNSAIDFENIYKETYHKVKLLKFKLYFVLSYLNIFYIRIILNLINKYFI